jgi:hypothetical protein
MSQQTHNNSIKRKRTWKKSAGFVLSFVLFLGLCGMFFSLDLWIGFLNKQSVVTAAADSQYPARAYEQLKEDLEALMKEHSLDSQAALTLVSENEFYVASGNQITASLKGETNRTNTLEFQQKLLLTINQTLTDGGVPLTAEINQAVNEVVFTAGNLYSTHASFQFGDQFTKAREKMVPILRMMFFVSCGISFIAGLALVVFYRRRHAALSYINYALFGSVIANLLVVGLLYVTNPMGKTDASLYYQNFIERYITQSLIPGLGLSAIGLIIAGVLWVIIRRIQKEA